MTDPIYCEPVQKSTDFFDYAERHDLALLALHPGGKKPLGENWPSRSSRDPAQWRAWRDEGLNLGVLAGESRLITIDLDTTKEGGRDGVWQRYAAWCVDSGLPVYAAHVSTARMGMHIYFRLPEGADAMALKANAKKLGPGIDILVGNKQSVAPGSKFEGSPYILFAGAPPPHPAPGALIEHCTPKHSEAAAPRTAALPEYDATEVGEWIDYKVKHHWQDDETSPWCDQGEWIFFGKALKLHFPNEDGFELWMRATHDGHDEAAKRWDSANDFKPDYAEGMRTLAYYLKPDTTWMFRGVLSGKTLSPPIAPTSPLPPGVPLPGPCDDHGDEEAAERPISAGLREHRINAASLEGKAVPERAWQVLDLIPAKNVTLLYGDGGTGKSLLALQLGAAVATGKPFFGHAVTKGPVEFITAEDSLDEMHRRLVDISRAAGTLMGSLSGLHLTSLAEADAILAAAEDSRGGKLAETALYHELESVIAETRPALVVLDTLADIYGGNEIIRAQARQFIGMLRRLCLRYDCTIIVLAHPSLAGMEKGTSGSTGWSNSVRSRLYFTRIHESDGSEVDEDARVLRVGKSNYGRVGLEIRMQWRTGVFASTGGSGGDPIIRVAKADRVFLELLAKARAQNVNVHFQTGRGYAPDAFKSDGTKEHVNKADLAAAMKRLLDAGKIENAPFGPPSRIRYRLQLAGGA